MIEIRVEMTDNDFGFCKRLVLCCAFSLVPICCYVSSHAEFFFSGKSERAIDIYSNVFINLARKRFWDKNMRTKNSDAPEEIPCHWEIQDSQLPNSPRALTFPVRFINAIQDPLAQP